MSALDSSIVNIILPVLRAAFATNVAAVEWVVTVYLLMVSGVLLAFGRLGDLRGHKTVYLAGFIGFVASSALCGCAPSLGWLVTFRALQAIAAAMLFANSPAILTKSFPTTQRGRALGMQATMTYLGLTIGPVLGGVLAQYLGWRSVFYINLPVGAVGLYLGYRFIPRDEPERTAARFDRAGATLFFAGLFALLLALNQGHAWGWGSTTIIGLLLGSLAALTIFVLVERRHVAPMLDLSLFAHPSFSGSAFTALATYVALFILIFLMPFYLIQGRGLDAAHAGLIMTAQPVVMMVVAPIAGALSDRLGSRPLSMIGLVLLSLGFSALCRLDGATPLWHVAGGLALCGLGFGFFVAPNNSRLMGAAPRNRQGIAAAVLAASRNLGMVFGVAVAGAIFTTVLAEHGVLALPVAIVQGFEVALGITAVAFAVTWLEPWMKRSSRLPA